jgi:serine/threonine-protein phosphatase 2A regulatory subunit A
MKSLPKFLRNVSTDKITSFLLPTIQSLYEESSAHFKADLSIALCEMSKYVGKEITISKILPIILDLIKDEDPDVRLNCTKNGMIKLADIIGQDLLSD